MPGFRSKTLDTANAVEQLTSGVYAELFEARKREFIHKVIFKSYGTNSPNVARVYINNGSPVSQESNNSFVADVTLADTTASQTAKQSDYEVTLGYWIPEGSKVLVSIGSGTTDNWQATLIYGDEYAERYVTQGDST